MPKPYSIDLRERVIKAYHHGKEPIKRKENTISGVAKRFDVSVKFLKNLLRLYRETGSVTPKPHAGGQTPKLKATGLKFLKQTVKQSPDLCIEEYTQIYNDNFDEPVSASTIGRALLKLELTRKKKTLCDPRKFNVSNQLKTKLYQLALLKSDPEQLIYRRCYWGNH